MKVAISLKVANSEIGMMTLRSEISSLDVKTVGTLDVFHARFSIASKNMAMGSYQRNLGLLMSSSKMKRAKKIIYIKTATSILITQQWL
jgi:hypothetical protein